MTWNQVLEVLESWKKDPEALDVHIPPTAGVIDYAIRVVDETQIVGDDVRAVVPDGDGGVSFYWDGDQGEDCGLTVYADCTSELFVCDKSKPLQRASVVLKGDPQWTGK